MRWYYKWLDGVTDDPDDFSALSSRLEHLPLALVQAAAFIKKNRHMTIKRYIELLDKKFQTVGRVSKAPLAVAAPWILLFKQIQCQDPLVGDLLSITSLFNRHAIPDEKGAMQYFAEQALSVVSGCFSPGDYENWMTSNTYLPHAFAVLNLKEGIASNNGKLARARLLFNAGRLAQGQGQFQTAEMHLKEATELTGNPKEVLREEHPQILTSMKNLASTYQSQGRWKEAELLHLQVLDIRKRMEMGRLNDSLELFSKCLRLRQKVQGPDNLATMTTRGWRGMLRRRRRYW
ncbi:kinesin light chain [Triangularia setosa]|uniref:Kinesin light chain n=1 Tax=Triangularia setosa TaxID=2587417 RepID=A0AAN6WE33_9PEZI|nr:kinesin light chain [Podospora setosa]